MAMEEARNELGVDQKQEEEKWVTHYSSKHQILLMGEGGFSFSLSLASSFGSASSMCATSRLRRSCNMGKKRSKMYSSNHNILLVGEGDFSFSSSLATRFGSAPNIVATSLDSREELVRKYSKAEENLNVLENLGCKILHGIDVHTMSKRACLKRKLFDRIVFNFPHAGFFYRERDPRQIRLHQDLVRGFLRNAKKMLEEDGEVHITHKTGYPYDEWKIENIAEEVGLCLKSLVPFLKHNYPGYINRRGDGAKCNKTFPVGECSTFKFKKSAPADNVYPSIKRLSLKGDW